MRAPRPSPTAKISWFNCIRDSNPYRHNSISRFYRHSYERSWQLSLANSEELWSNLNARVLALSKYDLPLSNNSTIFFEFGIFTRVMVSYFVYCAHRITVPYLVWSEVGSTCVFIHCTYLTIFFFIVNYCEIAMGWSWTVFTCRYKSFSLITYT